MRTSMKTKVRKKRIKSVTLSYLRTYMYFYLKVAKKYIIFFHVVEVEEQSESESDDHEAVDDLEGLPFDIHTYIHT
jgi:hypothetical protein